MMSDDENLVHQLQESSDRTGDRVWDMRSYVAIHMALIFGIGGIISGSIWA